NYAGAVEAYRELRLLLHRELNAEPDPETKALFAQIRTEARERATLGARCSALGSTVGGRPAAFPPELELSPLAPSTTSAASPARETRLHHLPVQLTRFIGREPQIAEVKQFLATHRLVTLTGTGGCGKTRLALQVGSELLQSFSDGVWFVELAPLADATLVLPTVASRLGVREEGGQPLIE